MNYPSIEKAFKQKKERGWNTLYWAIDCHDTLIAGKYNRFNVGAEIYPGAQDVLQYLYSRADTRLILWSSMHDDATRNIRDRLKYTYGVKFHWYNENPECPNTELCDFSQKFYFNILIEDKANFCAEDGWFKIKQDLIELGEWKAP